MPIPKYFKHARHVPLAALLLTVAVHAEAREQTLGVAIAPRHQWSEFSLPLGCRQADALQLQIERGDVRLDYVRVNFRKGGSQRLDVRRDLRENDRTIWFKIADYRSCITSIDFLGRTRNSSDPARIPVKGRS